MAKSSKDRDRRAVVEQLRRDQKRSEQRRTIAVISVCALVGLVIIGLAAIPLIQQNSAAKEPLDKIGASASSAGCQDVVTKKATGNQEHQQEGSLIQYADAPPAFGPHYPVTAPFTRKYYTVDDRPTIPYVVHNLEHGYNLLWYDETIAEDKDQLSAVKAIAKKFEGEKPTDKFIALPWTGDDGKAFPKGAHVAMTHWSAGGDPSDTSKQQGVWQYCAKVSGASVRTFTEDYPYSDSPEPGAS